MNTMSLKKIFIVLVLVIFCVMSLPAENVKFVIEITHVVVNDGKVYLAVFANADEFRREAPFMAFELESSSTVLLQEVSIAPGEYLLSAYQDRNGNQELDYNLVGIPRELVAISNYFGRGIPTRNFDRHKVPIDASTGKVSIRLYKF